VPRWDADACVRVATPHRLSVLFPESGRSGGVGDSWRPIREMIVAGRAQKTRSHVASEAIRGSMSNDQQEEGTK
jgi:hypothetical protein